MIKTHQHAERVQARREGREARNCARRAALLQAERPVRAEQRLGTWGRVSQLDLLSHSPVARYLDPSTSHEAARAIEKDGTRVRQQAAVLAAVAWQGGLTSFELARANKFDRFTAGRRLPELRASDLVENGEARPCTVTGKRSLTWWLKGAAPLEEPKN